MHDYNSEREWGENPKLTRDMKITVLSGAGISAESGIPTFRGAGGLWSDETLRRKATPRGF
ncbi:MAG: Sir2 family NAD-dependent protein deacetylase, partial [bacterium]